MVNNNDHLVILYRILKIASCLITSVENVIRLPPFMEIFASARGAAKNVFAVIDRKSEIDSLENDGKVLDTSQIQGNIEFKDVLFCYPSRSDVQV